MVHHHLKGEGLLRIASVPLRKAGSACWELLPHSGQWGLQADLGGSGFLRKKRVCDSLLVVLDQNMTIFEKIFPEAWLIVKKEKQHYTVVK